ncbi:hypothetical protein ANN_17693 [Periplaneta americana]|uniref:Uncharacterized protein n=1 Tax=Periplaneta americana TaxID=6978 RepID=A0ABQ8STM7_PERAM|nr:hypothetical protein ANN_17693 [Periplaneta americana]
MVGLCDGGNKPPVLKSHNGPHTHTVCLQFQGLSDFLVYLNVWIVLMCEFSLLKETVLKCIETERIFFFEYKWHRADALSLSHTGYHHERQTESSQIMLQLLAYSMSDRPTRVQGNSEAGCLLAFASRDR